MTPAPPAVRAGAPLPLGIHRQHDGVNVAVFSRHATRVEILLFESHAVPEPFLVVDLDPATHRTGDIWHALIDGLDWGRCYALRAAGPFAPREGHRFDATKILLDPRARALASVPAAASPGAKRQRCLLVDSGFDWQGTGRPKRPWRETVIYETHVRGLSIHPAAAAAHAGTFLGLIEKIGYFAELGVTAVELMPVHAFDPRANGARDPVTGALLANYWGYDTVGFFAPHPGYGSAGRAGRGGRGIQEHGPRAAPGRAGSDSRRRPQSHRRGRRRRTDLPFPRHRQRDSLPARPRALAVLVPR